jgi:hypothetical protein
MDARTTIGAPGRRGFEITGYGAEKSVERIRLVEH